MSRAERFSIIAAIIGFSADIVGLSTFIAGIWLGNLSLPTNAHISTIWMTISAIIIFYGWGYISYYFASKKMEALNSDYQNEREDYNSRRPLLYKEKGIMSSVLWNICLHSTIPLGIVAFPVTVLWFYALYTNSYELYRNTIENVIISSIFIQFGIGFLIVIVLYSLIPTLHRDMKIHYR